MKKLFAVLVALTLVLSMGTIAFAEGTTATGTITISDALKGSTYNIYKMFDFEAVAGNAASGRYTYASEDWEYFVEEGDGKAYLAFNEEKGTIEWIGAKTADGTPDATAVSALAKAAVAYAKEKKMTATATKDAAADGAVTFEGVALGYYAIDTSLGTICALTNVDNTFDAHEKNEKPDIDKFVQEDSEMNNADEGWGKVNDADIDQKVNYKSTITVGLGATNYVMHDTMTEGLTFNNDVTVVASDASTPVYTVKTTGLTDGCTFEVVFDNDYIAKLAKGTTLTVYYSATLNEKAKIAEIGNDNTVKLTYGEDSKWETAEHKTRTFTWKMDVLKYTMDGTSKISLAGATFQLLKDGAPLTFTRVADTEGVPTYMYDKASTTTDITTDENGKFILVGLDEGTYYLHEEEAPVGYNKLAADMKVVISSTHADEALNATYKINNADPATIEVENKTGGLLPETGGIGTTIFYVVGGLLMAAAFILLVSKKRMASFA